MPEQARSSAGQIAKLLESERNAQLVVNGVSVLRQICQRLPIPAGDPLLSELLALSRAQRRTLKTVHRVMEADPLFAHLLQSRVTYRRAEAHRTKSGKRLEELVVSSFFVAQRVGFRGSLEEWRRLLAIFPEA